MSVKTYRAESNPKRKKIVVSESCKYLFTDTGTYLVPIYVISETLSKNFNWSLSHLMNLTGEKSLGMTLLFYSLTLGKTI